MNGKGSDGMKAIVLAAGFGKRLRPLTDYLPKVLVPVLGVPAIDHVLRRLHDQGVRQVGVNVHYRADQVREHLEADCRLRKDIKICIAHEEEILGTGGALDNFRNFLRGEEPFWVYNGDIISDLDLASALRFHQARKALATLVLWDYPPINTVAVDREGNIISLFEKPNSEPAGRDCHSSSLTFTGISILSSRILDYLPDGYSEMPRIYQDIIACRGIGKICGFRGQGNHWADFGTISSYLDVHRDLVLDRSHKGVPSAGHTTGCVHRAGAGIVISSRAQLRGFISIADGCIIEDNVFLEDCVLWPGTRVSADTRAQRAILGNGFICREG